MNIINKRTGDKLMAAICYSVPRITIIPSFASIFSIAALCKTMMLLSLTRRTYALIMSPVAMSLEELIPSDNLQFHIYSILIRTALVLSTLFVGLSVPFFGKPRALFIRLWSNIFSFSTYFCISIQRSRLLADGLAIINPHTINLTTYILFAS